VTQGISAAVLRLLQACWQGLCTYQLLLVAVALAILGSILRGYLQG
jgi:hypothetical protein